LAEAFIEIGSGDNRLEQREGAIVKFHYDAVQRTERIRNFDQMEYERLVLPEHLSRGDAEQKRVTNLPSGARHSDLNRSFHNAISHKRLGEQSQRRDRLTTAHVSDQTKQNHQSLRLAPRG